MKSCHCDLLKIAVGLIGACLVALLALVGVVGAVFGCRKWCRKRKKSRSGRVGARYRKQVDYDSGKDCKWFKQSLGYFIHAYSYCTYRIDHWVVVS